MYCRSILFNYLGKQGPIQGNKAALATVTGIVDGTGSVGAALGQVYYTHQGPYFIIFWDQNKAPFPSQKSIYFSSIFKKNSPTTKQKQNKQARLNIFFLKLEIFTISY